MTKTVKVKEKNSSRRESGRVLDKGRRGRGVFDVTRTDGTVEWTRGATR